MNQEKENVTLNITDLKNLLIVVDYAAEQGAFKGWNNIRNVLNLRDKLEKFIKSVTPEEKTSEEKKVLQEPNEEMNKKSTQIKKKK